MENNENSTYHKWKKVIGTSYHGHEFLSTIEELKQVFGKPDAIGDKDDKVQFEWILELEISNSLGTIAPITIYDWKEFRDYHEAEYIRFHIGGHSGNITELAKIEIQNVLNLFRDEE
jgi:hypothetical protein